MYELVQVAPHTYYVQSPAKCGLYVDSQGNATLIDTGNDKEAGRKINQHLKANDWTLARIINTHSNADHVGGNAFLQQRTECEIVSTEIENLIAKYPHLEPSFIYGGFPPKPLCSKALMAQPSVPSGNIGAGNYEGFEIIPLPGHFLDMIGVRTPDDILFLGDCVFSAQIVEKYHINFLYDLEKFLETLNMLETLTAKLFVPAHAEPMEDIRALVEVNRSKVMEIIALIQSLCKEPRMMEDVLKGVFDHYGLHMDFAQYALVGSTIRSYLSYLLNQGQMEVLFEGNRLLWKTL